MNKYPKIRDYTATVIDAKENELLALACCDCGLVHFIKLDIIGNGRVQIAFKRSKRATAQLRYHNYGYLQQGSNKKHEMVRRANPSQRNGG